MTNNILDFLPIILSLNLISTVIGAWAMLWGAMLDGGILEYGRKTLAGLDSDIPKVKMVRLRKFLEELGDINFRDRYGYSAAGKWDRKKKLKSIEIPQCSVLCTVEKKLLVISASQPSPPLIHHQIQFTCFLKIFQCSSRVSISDWMCVTWISRHFQCSVFLRPCSV